MMKIKRLKKDENEENEGRKMVFKPIENRKISSRIMEQIKENILRGKLRVGDKLPSERELSTQLGVSRSSVREALRSLDILGVVVSVQGEGTYIQGDFQDSLCMLMTFMYFMNGCKLKEALQLREILEIESIVHSASRWTEQDIQELEKYCDLLEGEGSEEEKSEYDKNFHDKIAEMSGNSLMIIILSSASYIIQHIIKSAREKILFHECIDQVSMQHRRILEAIRLGNTEEIKRRMQEHMQFVSEALRDVEEEEI